MTNIDAEIKKIAKGYTLYSPPAVTDALARDIKALVEKAYQRGLATYKYCSDMILAAGLPTIQQGNDARLAAPKAHILDDAGQVWTVSEAAGWERTDTGNGMHSWKVTLYRQEAAQSAAKGGEHGHDA